MKINVQMKAAGKKKPLEDREYELPESVNSACKLITELVRQEVLRYNAKKPDTQAVSFLTGEELEQSATLGKVGFGRIYSDKKPDVQRATDNALQCFKDGIVKIFHNDMELTAPDEEIAIADGDSFTFIRLTFLAGRLW